MRLVFTIGQVVIMLLGAILAFLPYALFRKVVSWTAENNTAASVVAVALGTLGMTVVICTGCLLCWLDDQWKARVSSNAPAAPAKPTPEAKP